MSANLSCHIRLFRIYHYFPPHPPSLHSLPTCTLGNLEITGFRKSLTFRPVVLRRARMTSSTSSAVSALRTHTTLGSPKAVGERSTEDRREGGRG